MPWVPELFSAPALEHILDERRRDALLAVPYFDGLLAGDPDPLVESFAGEPEVHDALRGRVKGVAAFRAFVVETSQWLREHGATVDDVAHVVLEGRGFEEVVLRSTSEGIRSAWRSQSSRSAGPAGASARYASTSTTGRSPGDGRPADRCSSPTPD